MGAANTGFAPIDTLAGLRFVQSIGFAVTFVLLEISLPGSPGIPAGCEGTHAEPKEASKINEFPVVLPTASVFVRVGPEPPGSSGFFQMYCATGPAVGESPQ